MKFFTLILVVCSMAASAQQKIKVACVGNSISEGLDIDSAMRYPVQLQRLLGDQYEVRNYGVSGRTLLKKGDFPYWQEAKYQQALAWEPNMVIIKLGTNDSKPQNWIYNDEFEKDYRDLIQSFKKLPSKPRVFICMPVPVFKEAWEISESVVKDEIIPMILNIAKAEGVTLIDLYTPLQSKPDLLPDGVHPNAEGATIIAQTVAGMIKQK